MKNKYIYLTLCLLGLLIPRVHAQIVSVAQGSGFNIKAGTVIGAEGLDITPSADFSLTSSLSKSNTLTNSSTIPYINRSYKFGATTAAFSGALQLNYQDSELNGLTESNLKLLYHDGAAWAASNGSINNAIANYETATLTSKPLNELSLGINNGTSTTILDSQCGTTLAALNSTISCYPVTGATSYVFKVTSQSTGVVNSIRVTTNSFNLSQISSTLFNTSYSISVGVYVGVIFKGYGSSCTITTPYPVTKVQSTQCGTTLAALNTTISAVAVINATGYRFEVTNGTTLYSYDSLTKTFNLSQLNVPVLYGASYSIRVAVKYNNVWQPYGDSCLVYTPAAPLTKLQTTQCGITLASGNATVLYATSVSVAQMYRFEVSLGTSVYTYDTASSSVRSFKMTAVSGLTLVNGTTYGVRVAIKANGVWQPYGSSCTVTTFGVAPVARATALLDEVGFNVLASPSPFTDNFNFKLTSSSSEKISILIYDMTGKLFASHEVSVTELSELQVGNNFPSGVYNVIVSQGQNIKTMRVVKR